MHVRVFPFLLCWLVCKKTKQNKKKANANFVVAISLRIPKLKQSSNLIPSPFPHIPHYVGHMVGFLCYLSAHSVLFYLFL